MPGVEAVDDNSYRRTISLNGHDGHIHVSLNPRYPALDARIRFGDPRALFLIVERIRRLFDLNADWAQVAQNLGSDPMLARCLKAQPGLRVPGCWDGFELAVRAILTQSAGPARSSALAGALVQAFGRKVETGDALSHIFPAPGVLADADVAAIGVAPKPARTIRALGRAVADGRIAFEGLTDTDAFLARLQELTGMEPSTAEYIVMRAAGEPDIFPADARNLQTGFDCLSAFRQRAEKWRPWRSYAAITLANSVADPALALAG